jgi:four helix bundle protein
MNLPKSTIPNLSEPLIPKHGGYRNLKSFQIAQLCYDVTERFCDRYISPMSRTHDQMVQAARSGVQNIAEGSQASGTSKKFELKLTNVARASLEELRLDYEDFLRQRGLPLWRRERSAEEGAGGPALRHRRRGGGLGGRGPAEGWTGWTEWTAEQKCPVHRVHPVHSIHLPRDRGECRAGSHRSGLCPPRSTDCSAGGGLHGRGWLHGAAAPGEDN